MTHALPQTKRNQIVKAYASGRPISEIAKTFNVAKSTPGQLAKRAGVALRTPKAFRKLMAQGAECRWRKS